MKYLRHNSLYALAVVLVVVLLLAACAPVRVYVEDGITYHEGDVSPCGGDAGCTIGMKHVYYPAGDMFVLQHERDHLRGMHHGKWLMSYGDSCAAVIATGTTEWALGRLLCRRANGTFYQR